MYNQRYCRSTCYVLLHIHNSECLLFNLFLCLHGFIANHEKNLINTSQKNKKFLFIYIYIRHTSSTLSWFAVFRRFLECSPTGFLKQHKKLCSVSIFHMLYSWFGFGSGSSFSFSKFQIRNHAQVPDSCGSRPYY